jgi:hypothetical protein
MDYTLAECGVIRIYLLLQSFTLMTLGPMHLGFAWFPYQAFGLIKERIKAFSDCNSV